MTIVAYRDGVMAGDRCMCIGDTALVSPLPKVTRTVLKEGKVALTGCGGDASLSRKIERALLDHLRNGPPEQFETQIDIEMEANVLLVTDWWSDGKNPNPRVYVRGKAGMIWLDVDRWAIGSGVDYALGAMYVGASAVEACETSIALDVRCRGPVDRVPM